MAHKEEKCYNFYNVYHSRGKSIIIKMRKQNENAEMRSVTLIKKCDCIEKNTIVFVKNSSCFYREFYELEMRVHAAVFTQRHRGEAIFHLVGKK